MLGAGWVASGLVERLDVCVECVREFLSFLFFWSGGEGAGGDLRSAFDGSAEGGWEEGWKDGWKDGKAKIV